MAVHAVPVSVRNCRIHTSGCHCCSHLADPPSQTRDQVPGPVAPGEGHPRRARAAGQDGRGGGLIMLTLAHFLTLGAILFSIGVAGIFLNRKNIIILLMSIELLLLAVNMNFVAFSRFLDNMDGQVFVFFILTVAAAEAAIGLAILVVLFRNRETINVEDIEELKG